MTYNIKNTQLDDIEVLPGDQHILPVDESSSISPLSTIDILYEEFINFKTFVCQGLNFIKQELFDVKQNTNKSDRRNCNYELKHELNHYTAQETITFFDVPGNFVFLVVLLAIFTMKLHVTQLEKLPEW